MPQTSYALGPAAGYAGYAYDSASSKDVSACPAAEEIPFGMFVEKQVDGTVRLWRGTGKPLGVSLGRDTREGGPYAVGGSASYKQYSSVPVMRRGRMYMQFASSAAGVALTAPNLWTPSDNSLSNLAKRGAATSQATSATTGAEIVAQASGIVFWKAPAATDTVCVVELSFS